MEIDQRPQKTSLIIAQRSISDVHHGEMDVGGRLPSEHEMLEAYGVGRGTLREALRYLEFQGVIELKPGPKGGPVLRRPDASAVATALTLALQFQVTPFRQVPEARRELEPMLARMAAENMTDEKLEALEENIEMMGQSLKTQRAFLTENRKFHHLVAHGSGNTILGYFVDSLVTLFSSSVNSVEYSDRRRKKVLEAHAGIFEAIASRDGDRAWESMHGHIEEYMTFVKRKHPDVLTNSICWCC